MIKKKLYDLLYQKVNNIDELYPVNITYHEKQWENLEIYLGIKIFDELKCFYSLAKKLGFPFDLVGYNADIEVTIEKFKKLGFLEYLNSDLIQLPISYIEGGDIFLVSLKSKNIYYYDHETNDMNYTHSSLFEWLDDINNYL